MPPSAGDEKIAALRPYATAINYKTDDFAEKIGQLTNDEGVDVILDIVGGPYFNRNLGLLKRMDDWSSSALWAGESLMRLIFRL